MSFSQSGGNFTGPQITQAPDFQPYQYAPLNPMPEERPGLMSLLAQSLGTGLGEGVAGGIKQQLKRSALERMLENVNPNMSAKERLLTVAGADEATQPHIQEYFKQLDKERENQAFGNIIGNQRQSPSPQQQNPQFANQQPTPVSVAQQEQIQNQPQQPQVENPVQQPQAALTALEDEERKIFENYAATSPEQKKFLNKRLSDIKDAKRDIQLEESNQRRKEAQEEKLASIKSNEDYVNQISKDYENYVTKKNIINNSERLAKEGKLGTPGTHALLHALNLPTGILDNPSAEEYEKFSQQFMNDVSSVFPGALRVAELESYANQIPRLINTDEGKLRILKDLKKINEARKVKYDTYLDISKNGTHRPLNLREQVNQKTAKKLEKLEEELIDSANYFKPVKMYKDGKEYDIPATFINKALQRGYMTKPFNSGAK